MDNLSIPERLPPTSPVRDVVSRDVAQHNQERRRRQGDAEQQEQPAEEGVGEEQDSPRQLDEQA